MRHSGVEFKKHLPGIRERDIVRSLARFCDWKSFLMTDIVSLQMIEKNCGVRSAEPRIKKTPLFVNGPLLFFVGVEVLLAQAAVINQLPFVSMWLQRELYGGVVLSSNTIGCVV